ncbi:hypothetical protein [Thermomonas sp.]|uniref:hypothetical protein n=1 Tax=Thermomonas sp. TaxID=1971895 RepID=UPI001D8AEE3F|nr:hypothetical protein [Thermomonas sp.]MBZ0088401.1 hypothetical protein [Thermomonas sp.]HRO63301.1 hypothetical protein [Thermomonas sp.]
MTKLRMAQAPTPAVPRLFLRSAALWGVVAGGLLAVDGEAALTSRWSGATLALVHALTLGFLGNAMFGALLQFLPVAVGVQVRGGATGARLLHLLLNAGVVLLMVGFCWPQWLGVAWGGGLLLAAFLLLATLVLPGLRQAQGEGFLRLGMGLAVLAALVTAALGLLLALGWSGWLRLPQLAMTDAHAGWGLLGWVLGLLAAVARVVGPMFQGSVPAPARVQGGWQVVLYALLAALLTCAARGVVPIGMRVALALPVLAFAVGGLWLQLGARHLRRAPLTYFWSTGFIALAIAGSVLLAGGNALLVGTLSIGIGLPLLVTGMMLEIIAFLGWIELQRECGRGVHVPGVQLLVPARDKAVVLALQLLAGVLLALAVWQTGTAVVAGAALLLAHAAAFVALGGARRRGRRFVAERVARR